MIVTVYNKQQDLEISIPTVQKQARAVLNFKKIKTDEVIIHFVDETKICELHFLFFNDPTPTDCITLPIDKPDDKKIGRSILGEIFISAAEAVKFAKEHNIDKYEELTLYLIHGLLHLIGYNDIDKKERDLMRKEEKTCMNLLKEKKLL